MTLVLKGAGVSRAADDVAPSVAFQHISSPFGDRNRNGKCAFGLRKQLSWRHFQLQIINQLILKEMTLSALIPVEAAFTFEVMSEKMELTCIAIPEVIRTIDNF